MADTTISQLNQGTPATSIVVPWSDGTSTYQAKLSSLLTATGDIGTEAIQIPRGTTNQRPSSSSNGMLRMNTTTNMLEAYYNNNWIMISSLSPYSIYLWGAGGGGGTPGGWGYGAAGGGGGFASGDLNLSSGSTITLVVGQGGIVNGTSVSFGGGGQASRNNADNRYGSNGGGYTGIFLNSVTQANCLLLAGGGGGGGSSRAGTGNYGGAGGGTQAQDGNSPYDNKPQYRGRGAGQSGPPVQASCDPTINTNFPPAALIGGTCQCNSYGGAGGGGYFGGSAGGFSEGNTMGGGGGGSGYVSTQYISNSVNTTGTDSQGAGNTNAYYPGNVGSGGAPSTTGQNGYAVLLNRVTGQITRYSYTGSNITITL
jgi:hypothetical protein